MGCSAVIVRRPTLASCLATAAALTLPLSATCAQTPAPSERQATDLNPLDALRACTAIATAPARLACFDRAMTANAGSLQQVRTEENVQESDREPKATVIAREQRTSQGAAEPETGFDITVVSVTASSSRPTQFQTDTGDAWVQTSRGMRRYPPTPFVAHVELRGVGSLWMDLDDGAPAVRVFKPR